MNSYLHVTHQSIPPFVPENPKILILGSFPSPGSRKAGFYYAYPTNRFFRVLSSLFGEKEPVSKERRMDFLSRHSIALYDVIESCDIIGASDSSIKNVVPSDIKALREKYSSIRMVFTTGRKAEELYLKYQTGEYLPLPSPSAANASVDFMTLKEKYSQILPFLN